MVWRPRRWTTGGLPEALGDLDRAFRRGWETLAQQSIQQTNKRTENLAWERRKRERGDARSDAGNAAIEPRSAIAKSKQASTFHRGGPVCGPVSRRDHRRIGDFCGCVRFPGVRSELGRVPYSRSCLPLAPVVARYSSYSSHQTDPARLAASCFPLAAVQETKAVED